MKVLFYIFAICMIGVFPPVGIPLAILAYAMDRRDLEEHARKMGGKVR